MEIKKFTRTFKFNVYSGPLNGPHWIIFTLLISIFLFSIIPNPTQAEVEREALGSGLGRFNAVAAEDIDDDGKCEIVVGNYEGFVIVLEYRDYDFYEEWRSEKLGHRMWGVIVADFIGDETKEIIAGNGDGDLYVFDAKTKKQVWHATDLVRDVHGLLVHKLGTTDTRYLLAGTGYKTDKDLGTVYIFTSESTEPIAQLGQFENRMRGLGVGDLDGDGDLELVVGSGVATGERPGEGYLRVYDARKVLENNAEPTDYEWKSENLKGDCVAVELADFTGDGNPDIVVGNGYRYQAGWVRIFTYDKNTQNYFEYWKSPDIGPKPYGLSVGDLDADDNLDIVVGNQPGYVYIYEQTGTGNIHEVWQSGLLGTDILGIDIEDVDNDGQQEIIATQGGYIGKGDYTSGYSDPHIYIIDGKTHEIEITLGETHPLGFMLEIFALVLFILFLVGLNYYLKFRQRLKDYKGLKTSQMQESKKGTITRPQPQIQQNRPQVQTRPSGQITIPSKTTAGSGMRPIVTTTSSATATTVAKVNVNDPFAKKPAAVVNDPFAKTPVPVVNDPFTKTTQPVVNDPFAKTPAPVVNDPFAKTQQQNKSHNDRQGGES